MNGVLVVVRPFAGWAAGDVIEDPTRAALIVASEHMLNVVRVAGPSVPTTHSREV